MKKILILLVMLAASIVIRAQEKIDLFIWAGQSNAQGWMGDGAYYPQEDIQLDESILLNWTFFGLESSGGQWITMQPQAGRFPEGHFGPEVSFSRELKKAGYHPAIFKYTKGATGLARDWKAPGEGGIYDRMVSDLKEAIHALEKQEYSVNIQGFIWIQGESDGSDDVSANAYSTNLHGLINDLRNKVLNIPKLKIILGVDEQHAFMKTRPQVVEAQKRIAEDDPDIIFTSMVGLQKADATHLTPAGLVQHGVLIFKAFNRLKTEGARMVPMVGE
jgi:hypothetical protein